MTDKKFQEAKAVLLICEGNSYVGPYQEPHASIRQAAQWLGKNVTGLAGIYVHYEVINFLLKTGMTLTGDHELSGLRVVARESFKRNFDDVNTTKLQLPQSPQLPQLPQLPQYLSTSVKPFTEFNNVQVLNSDEADTEFNNQLVLDLLEAEYPIASIRVMDSDVKYNLLKNNGTAIIQSFISKEETGVALEIMAQMDKLHLPYNVGEVK